MFIQDVAHGLQELLHYEGDVEDDFCLTFQVKKVTAEKLVGPFL